MRKEKEVIEYLVKNGDGELAMCRLVYRTICSAPDEERPELLEWFIIYSMMTKGNSSLKFAEDESAMDAKFMTHCGMKTFAIIKRLDKLELSEKEFYQRLWDYIVDPDYFSTGDEQSAALHACINGSRLPYFKLDKRWSADISGAKYENIYDSIGVKEVCKMQCIIEHHFDAISEQAAQLLHMIENQPSKERKIVMIAEMINYYKENPFLSLMDVDIGDLDDEDNSDDE